VIERFAGRYALLQNLGRGAMGEVFLARDLSTGGECALKRLHRGATHEIAKQMEEEFRLLTRVSHPAVVRVFELGFAPDGRPFLTMEYVPGLPADRALRPGDRAAFAFAAVQLALGLEALHAAGIIHGDLKPSNLLVLPGSDPSGLPSGVRLLDFGLARIAKEGAQHHSGTPGYAAPEVVRGGAPDNASDLYGLGATLYQLASGRKPFDAPSVGAILQLQQAGPPSATPLEDARVAPALQQLILRLLAPAPAERGDSATEIRRELARLFPAAIRPLAERLGAVQLIGRERELARLESWLAETSSRVRLQIVTGADGVGASALLTELAARAGVRRRRVIQLTGAAPPGAAAQVLLRRLLADAESAGLGGAPRTGRVADWLIADDATLADEDLPALVEVAAACLVPESSLEPPLVLVDDSAALDGVTRAMLRRLMLAPSESGGLRHMVWARHGVQEALGDDERALCDAGRADLLELEALGRADVARLASARLASNAPAGLVDWLWARGAGHPGFTIELLRQAATAGALTEDEIGLRVVQGTLDALAAPPTLQAALLARLMALDPQARATAAALAAWGRPVSLAELLGIEPRAVASVIDELVRAGLVTRDSSGALALSPPAIAVPLMELLNEPQRSALHEAVLRTGRLGSLERFEHLRALGRRDDALVAAEAAFTVRPDAQLAQAAAAMCESSDPVGAARWYERAGRELLDRARHAESIPLIERALELDPTGEARHERRCLLAQALRRLGDLKDLEGLLSEALADRPPDSDRAELVSYLGHLDFDHGRYLDAERRYREALSLAERMPDNSRLGFGCLALTSALMRLERFEEARPVTLRAIDHFRHAGNSDGALRGQSSLGMIDWQAGNYEEARRQFESAIQTARAQRERFALEALLARYAPLSTEIGRWRVAREQIGEALQLALEDSRGGEVAMLMTSRALIEGLTGRLRASLVHARAARRLVRASLPGTRANAMRALAQALRMRGRLKPAERLLRRGLSLASASAEEHAWGRRELGLLLLSTGRAEEARQLLSSDGAERPVHSASDAAVAILAGRSALRLGDLEGADRLLAAAETWRRDRPLAYFAALAMQLRAELALAGGQAAEGAALANQTLDALAALPAPADRAHAALEFSRLAYGEGSDDRAPVSRWLEEAASGFQRLGNLRDRERALALLVRRLKRLRIPVAVAGRAHDLITAVRRLLDSLSDMRELAQRAMQLAVEQLDAERGVLLLLDDKTGQLVEMAEHGAVDATTRRSAAGYSRRVVQRVAESGGVVLMGDAASDPALVSESILDLHLQSILCVPMYVGGHVVGAVYLDDSRRASVFSEADRALLEGFAQLMAVAFEKSRGQQEVERVNRLLEGENIQLRMQAGVRFRTQNLVAVSSEMQRVLAVVERVASSDATVLLTGENGTGKELIALTLHHSGRRHERPFVAVNCGAIPAGLLEAELFGILGRVATDVAAREGRFVQANGGTLFLDEIAEMPAQQQVALLRVLSTREVTPVGGGAPIPVDVRIIAATNRDVVRLVETGAFREDLYHRLNVIPIEIPPLRDRKADIPALTEHFARQFADQQQRPVPQLSPELLAAVMQSDWPGNVRALQNYIERIMAMSAGPMLLPNPLPRDLQTSPATRLHGRKLAAMVQDLEQRMIHEALSRSGGNQSIAARELGLTEQSMRYRLRKYALASSRRKSRIRR
jgi:transcriptional regulator with GAF, ATPase, and Fis domain/tetratricopeptide (TPR) repeat protein